MVEGFECKCDGRGLKQRRRNHVSPQSSVARCEPGATGMRATQARTTRRRSRELLCDRNRVRSVAEQDRDPGAVARGDRTRERGGMGGARLLLPVARRVIADSGRSISE